MHIFFFFKKMANICKKNSKQKWQILKNGKNIYVYLTCSSVIFSLKVGKRLVRLLVCLGFTSPIISLLKLLVSSVLVSHRCNNKNLLHRNGTVLIFWMLYIFTGKQDMDLIFGTSSARLLYFVFLLCTLLWCVLFWTYNLSDFYLIFI